jgi:hypothetical protein
MLAVEKSQIAGIDPVAGVLSVMALFSTDVFFLTPNRAYIGLVALRCSMITA